MQKHQDKKHGTVTPLPPVYKWIEAHGEEYLVNYNHKAEFYATKARGASKAFFDNRWASRSSLTQKPNTDTSKKFKSAIAAAFEDQNILAVTSTLSLAQKHKLLVEACHPELRGKLDIGIVRGGYRVYIQET